MGLISGFLNTAKNTAKTLETQAKAKQTSYTPTASATPTTPTASTPTQTATPTNQGGSILGNSALGKIGSTILQSAGNVAGQAYAQGSAKQPTGTTIAQGSSYTPLGTYNDHDMQTYSPADYAKIQAAKNAYTQASQSGNQAGMDAAHAQAEAVRAQYGQYSGGVDGSNVIGLQQPMQQQQMAPQQQIQQSASTVGNAFDQARSIGQEFARQSDEGAVAVAAQYTQMVNLLDQLEAQVTGQIRGQMNGDDPALQSALGIIKQEAQALRDSSLEDLNARGLVQSGVYAEAMTRLNNGELTNIQQAVSSRFGDLQNQLNSAVMSMAQARIQALGTSQSSLNSMLQADRSTQAQIGMQGLGMGIEQDKNNMQNSQYYAGLNQEKELAYMNNATQKYGIDTQASTSKYGVDSDYNLGMYKTNQDNATQKYGIDKDAETSKYNADLGYKSSVYNADKDYAASIYGSNASMSNARTGASASNYDTTLARDKFNYQVDQDSKNRVDQQMAYVQDVTIPQMLKDSNGLPLNTVISQIDQSTFEPTVKAYMKNYINDAYSQKALSTAFPKWTPN